MRSEGYLHRGLDEPLVDEDADEHQQHRDGVRPPEEARGPRVHNLKYWAAIGQSLDQS